MVLISKLLFLVFMYIIHPQVFSFIKMVGLLFGFLGVYTIATRGNFLNIKFVHPLGNILALLTAIVVALYFVLNKKYERKRTRIIMIVPKISLKTIDPYLISNIY